MCKWKTARFVCFCEQATSDQDTWELDPSDTCTTGLGISCPKFRYSNRNVRKKLICKYHKESSPFYIMLNVITTKVRDEIRDRRKSEGLGAIATEFEISRMRALVRRYLELKEVDLTHASYGPEGDDLQAEIQDKVIGEWYPDPKEAALDPVMDRN